MLKKKRVTKKFSEKKNIFIKKISSFLGLTSLSLSLSLPFSIISIEKRMHR
jgi:hypothetical protein